MKRKNNLVKFAAVFVCLLCLTLTTAAQKRKTSARKTTKPAVTETTATPDANATEIREAAQKASTQLKNVTKFIYLLGSIAQGIEEVDNDIKARKASQSAIDLNTKNKEGVLAALRKLHSDLAPVEIDFRAKASLRTYVPQIGGISDIAAQAEEQAAAGQFKEAGRTLLQVVERLSDTLAAMP
jgi:hypothetical protein